MHQFVLVPDGQKDLNTYELSFHRMKNHTVPDQHHKPLNQFMNSIMNFSCDNKSYIINIADDTQTTT